MTHLIKDMFKDGPEAGLKKIREGYPDVLDARCSHCNGLVYFPCPGKFKTAPCIGCGRHYRLVVTIEEMDKPSP
ncbi:MAG: hypothetical protein AAB903_00535 [Patescibacteria group bacterium]